MDSILNELLERIKHLPLTRQAALIEYIDSLENETLSASEAARMLKCDRQTVIRMINRGDLPASKRGRNWLLLKKISRRNLKNKEPKSLLCKQKKHAQHKAKCATRDFIYSFVCVIIP